MEELTVKAVIKLMKKNVVVIALAGIVGLTAAFVFSSFITEERYEARVRMYVSSDLGDNPMHESNAVLYAQRAVATYMQLLQTNSFYNRVSADAQLDFSAGRLRSMVKYSSLSSTEVFEARVVAVSPETAKRIADSIAKIAPETIYEILGRHYLVVLDWPSTPSSPFYPDVLHSAIIGLLFGIFAAAAIIVIKDRLDETIKDGDELEALYGVPVYIDRDKRGQRPSAPFQKEIYKFIKAHIKFSTEKEGCKKIAVTSVCNNKKAFHNASNLAVSLSAENCAKVLLLDCNFNKSGVSNYFEIDDKPGLSDFLLDHADLNSVVNVKNNGLHVICAGTTGDDKPDLLSNEKFHELTRTFEEEYDYLIVNAPSINTEADALHICKLSDVVILSVTQKKTKHQEVKKAFATFDRFKINVNGLIIILFPA